jgi:hypothetical protein
MAKSSYDSRQFFVVVVAIAVVPLSYIRRYLPKTFRTDLIHRPNGNVNVRLLQQVEMHMILCHVRTILDYTLSSNVIIIYRT